ncbi:GNAT family N-acetyltransferase [Streptantibioticus ferralitis]|uniref:GNAT family N-acetyltransferase n=1 Tax=Streptantibioticus ferralitis TaxID=236510 RepID=A0ABT5YSJ8_9ACTN|nr:GNAT family N-acetyltransferase [Streptantibioticus ferralitis]MDF2254587.1 GNAT family N-acetyltransferase [Streptantibioticus ferralitis]
MDIIIRGARPDELDTIGELTARTYVDEGLLARGADSPYVAVLRDVRHRAEHSEVLVAADAASDQVLGSVTFAAPGSAYAEVAGPGEGEFRMLVVAADARRRGAAEQLVRACLDRARALGLRRVVISSAQQMTAAHRLYRRLGFRRTPERDWEAGPGALLWTFAVEL